MSYEGFNANNAAMLLIDHQVGTMSWVHSTSFEEMKNEFDKLNKNIDVDYQTQVSIFPGMRQTKIEIK